MLFVVAKQDLLPKAQLTLLTQSVGRAAVLLNKPMHSDESYAALPRNV